MKTEEYIISANSCNGEEGRFLNWMKENYPEIETTIEETISGGYYVDGELKQDNFYDQFGRD